MIGINAKFAPEMPTAYLFITALNGLLSVGLGALGAHALHDRLLARDMLNAWHTASVYQLAHAIAALAIAALALNAGDNRIRLQRIGWCWLIGSLFFSCSIYVLALGGPKWLGPVTPLGGLAFMAGWILLAVEAFRPRAV